MKETKYAGTQTEKNLMAAFAGESEARNKYTYFASKAKKEGYEQIAALFLKTADNEKEHAKLWFKELNGIGDTAENLLAAAEGENYEWTDMYDGFVKDTGVPVICCGEPMSEIIPGTTDAAVEKHVPVWTVENGIVHVKVGSVEHPMLPEHYIEWVSLHTKQGNQRKELHPGEKPEVCFALCEGDEVEAVYAYCNLHSLWKA